MAPFYGWGSTGPRLESLRGGSSVFTTKCKSPEIPGTHFIELGRIVKDLTNYLSARGLNTYGRKVELIARAFPALELKMKKIASSEELQ